ncbi:MAG: hypothetical protein AABZ14_06920 [Candidatus Margulisiibacteriota bacterium]
MKKAILVSMILGAMVFAGTKQMEYNPKTGEVRPIPANQNIDPESAPIGAFIDGWVYCHVDENGKVLNHFDSHWHDLDAEALRPLQD